jgi:hypothetical protein
MLLRLVLLLVACGLCLPIARAQTLHSGATNDSSDFSSTSSFSPQVKPTLSVPHLNRVPGSDAAITIDGVLDDAGWHRAARVTGFSETFPGDQTRPPVDIVAYIAYDDTHLYVAYEIQDDPDAIRATMTDRDNIWQDDYSGMLLDTNGDGQQVYFIAANPLGIQGDTRISHGGEDVSFDLIYESEGRITEDGYVVEMAVPLRSIRFPQAEEQSWRATFWITHPRDSRSTYSWAAIDRDDPCMACQLGTLTDIRGITAGKHLELLPAFTGSQVGSLNDDEDAASGFDNDRFKAEPSFNLKYGITSDLTLDATVNPDFSQIEADAAQIDVNSTFALFFPERRPFFQEGSELFDSFIQTVYTRSINNPIGATKLTGRLGQTSVGYIGARDNDSPLLVPLEESSEFASGGESISNIVRVQHNFLDNSYVGALLTDRRLDDGGAGSTIGVDGVWRFWTKYQIEGQFVASRTAEPNDLSLSEDFDETTFADGDYTTAFDGETFGGYASYLSVERNARHYSLDVDFWQTSPTFRAANGFVTQNDNRRFHLWQGYTFYPEKVGFIDQIRPALVVGRIWNFDGLRKDEWVSPMLWARLKGQTNVNVQYIAVSNERFQGTDFRGIRRLMVYVNSNFSQPVKLGGAFSAGRSIARNEDVPVLGHSLNLSGWATLQPTQRLILEPEVDYARLEHPDTGEALFDGYILRTRLNYQFTRRLFTRIVVQYNEFAERLEVDPLVTYRINPFSAFHVGSTHDLNTYERANDPNATFFRQSQRQFFFKFQYLFRI